MKPKLYKYQAEAYGFTRDREYTALFMETGTGKTLVSLEVLKYWKIIGRDRFVVIVPNSLTGVWIAEAAKWDFPLRIKRLEGSGATKAKQILMRDWDVVVLNYESLRSVDVMVALTECKPEGVILDEMQRVKNRRAIQTRGSREIAKVVNMMGGSTLGLTGTPVVHSPLDLWAEADTLKPDDSAKNHPLRYGNYYAFENSIAIVIPHPHVRGAKIYKFPEDRLTELKSRVAEFAVEASKADCLDLPPRSFEVVYIPMEPEQQKIYDALREDYIATLDGILPPPEVEEVLGKFDLKPLNQNEVAMQMYQDIVADEDGNGIEMAKERRISVSFAATLMTRLQQVAAGHIKADDGTVHFIKGGKEVWLEENLPVMTAKGWDHKAILYCRFTADIKILSGICKRLGIGYVTLDGTNSKKAADSVERFQTDPDTRVFIGNLAVASTGITLTAADRVIYYTNSFNWGDRSQSEDRPYRIGQTRKVEYRDLCATNTVDEKVLENNAAKSGLAAMTVTGLKAVLKAAHE